MVHHYNDDGCFADDGQLVAYEDYRKLEIADDIFQKKVNQVLKDLTATPELIYSYANTDLAKGIDDAINVAIVDLEKAFSERTD